MRLHALLAGAAAGLVLTACAVLQVDVDVYKGPLANETHVQTQQVAVMAIGAKPLLEQLEARLEAVESDSPGEVEEFVRLVKDVRSLYGDRQISPFERKLREIDDAASDSKESRARFSGGVSPYAVPWFEFEKELVDDARATPTAPLGRLAAGYATLLNDQREKVEVGNATVCPIFKAHSDLVTTFPTLSSLRLPGPDVTALSSNAIWAHFERREVAAAHAALLFEPAKHDVQSHFVERVTRFARAFRETRQEYRRLMRAMAAALVAAHDVDADLSKQERGEFVELIADALPDLTSPDVVIELALAEGAEAELKSFLSLLTQPRFELPRTRDADPARDAAKRALNEGLRSHPVEVAKALLAADVFVPTEAFEKRMQAPVMGPSPSAERQELDELERVLLTKYRTPEWRATGLTAGVKSAYATDALNAVSTQKAVAYARTLSAFERGRTDEGLEKLIERYLVAAGNDACKSDPAPRERRQLLLGLLHFSEKLRFLANNLSFVANGDLDLTNDTVKVLETVANTIQVHVNELVRVAAHEADLDDDGEREKQALLANGDPAPCVAVERFIALLKDELRAAKKAAEQSEKEANEAAAALKKSNDDHTVVDKAATEAGKTATAAAQASKDATALRDDWQFLAKWLAKPSPEEQADLARLKQEKSVTDVVKLAVTILREPTPIALVDAAERERAAKTLESASVKKPFHGRPAAADAYDSTLNDVGRMVAEAEKALTAATDAAAAAEKARTAAATALAAAKEAVTDAKSKSDAAAKTAGEKKDEAKLLEDAVADAEAAKESTSDALLQVGATASRKQVQGVMASQVKASKSATSAASAAVIARRRSADLAWPTPATSDRSSVDVLDTLIAALRQAELRALADDGAASSSVAKIRAALAAAYEQRSGTIYLRPTSTYLRTSYAVSSLGTSGASTGENMLNDSAWSFIPFVGDKISDESSDDRDQRKRIDAQFWQSVNHVRVSGGGKTNYVVVKDDIGNWYVKGFAADPQKIYESVKNVALFNAGGAAAGARAALLKRGGNAGANAALGTSTGSGGSILDQQLQQAQAAYEKSTRELRLDVQKLAVGIVDEVRAAWAGDRELDGWSAELGVALDSGATGLAEAQKAVPDPEKAADAAGKLVDGLLAVKRFRHAVAKSVDEGVVGPKRKAVADAQKETASAEKALDEARIKELDALRAQSQLRAEPAAGTADHSAWEKDRDALASAVATAGTTARAAETMVRDKREAERTRLAERDAAQAGADRATRTLTDLVRAKLDDRIRKREKAIAELESAIGVISGVAVK